MPSCERAGEPQKIQSTASPATAIFHVANTRRFCHSPAVRTRLAIVATAAFLALGLAAQAPTPPQASSPRQTGRAAADSRANFPAQVRAPAGAPNVVLILLDDVGYGQTSTFGGAIATPNLDRLAKSGLRYTQFHTTAMCSPTRAALLTGRNHHTVSTGAITELATGVDGYTSILPKSAATIAEILRLSGYNTAAFGKWHNTPDWETSSAGPFDRWPTGLGFEHFYGFLGGDTNQWEPALIDDTRAIERPRDRQDYHLTVDLADRAIAWVRAQKSVAPSKPFFLYLAPGAAHAPHHAPKEWIDKYKGKFDHGWDRERELTFARQKLLGVIPPDAQLTPRPKELPAWGSLGQDERRLYARMEEVFAGFLSHADHEVGRVLDQVSQVDPGGNTLILYVVGDNGASPEGSLIGSVNEINLLNRVPNNLAVNLKMIDQLGGPLTYNHYPAGWAWAGSTPFQWMKQVASHSGGTRNPLVIAWPKGIGDAGGVRPQFHHVIDIAPTILEVAGISEPRLVNGTPQIPMEGVSMAYTFAPANASVPSRHVTQYFEMLGNRGMYQDGWKAASIRRVPWLSAPVTPDLDTTPWELYQVVEDFSEAHDVSGRYPQKLRELQDLFLAEAAQHHVLPIDDRVLERIDLSARPNLNPDRKVFAFFPGTVRVPEGTAPDLKNRSYAITADVELPPGGADGVLVTHGGRFGGYAFFVQAGRLHFVYNYLNQDRSTIDSTAAIPAGKVTLGYEFAYDGGGLGRGGTGSLFINGTKVGEGRIEKTIPYRVAFDETFDVGEDTGTPASESYQVPFRFGGKLSRVRVVLK
jgi:arylsulfatase A-like enzyme